MPTASIVAAPVSGCRVPPSPHRRPGAPSASTAPAVDVSCQIRLGRRKIRFVPPASRPVLVHSLSFALPLLLVPLVLILPPPRLLTRKFPAPTLRSLTSSPSPASSSRRRRSHRRCHCLLQPTSSSSHVVFLSPRSSPFFGRSLPPLRPSLPHRPPLPPPASACLLQPTLFLNPPPTTSSSSSFTSTSCCVPPPLVLAVILVLVLVLFFRVSSSPSSSSSSSCRLGVLALVLVVVLLFPPPTSATLSLSSSTSSSAASSSAASAASSASSSSSPPPPSLRHRNLQKVRAKTVRTSRKLVRTVGENRAAADSARSQACTSALPRQSGTNPATLRGTSTKHNTPPSPSLQLCSMAGMRLLVWHVVASGSGKAEHVQTTNLNGSIHNAVYCI